MTKEKPKIPTVEGLKRAQEARKKLRKKTPSEKLVRIINEITREKFPDVRKKDIAAKPRRMFEKCSIFIALLVVPTTLIGQNLGRRLFRYQPVVEEFCGKLRLVYFPGPPNYESIKEGDEREGVYILELEEPFDIAAANDPKKPLNDSEGWGRDVKRIQLIGNGALGKRVGKKITVRGKLSEAIFAHHHTSVVMEVLKVTGE